MAEFYEKMTNVGEKLGLSGEKLLQFVEKKAGEKEEKDREREEKDREREHREREREDRDKDREMRLKERSLEKDMLEKQIEMERLNKGFVYEDNGSSSNSKSMPHCPLPKLQPFDEAKENVDDFLRRFERYAQNAKWTKGNMALHLSALLKGKALSVYARLSPEQASDYDSLKDALLQRFQFTEEGFRNKFRNSCPETVETPGQFLSRIEHYLSRWMDKGKVPEESYEGLRDLFLKEQFLNSCGKNLNLFLREKRFDTLQGVILSAESYLEAHGYAEFLGRTHIKEGDRSEVDDKMFSSRNSSETVQKGLRCYGCRGVGHKIRDCKGVQNQMVSYVEEHPKGNHNNWYDNRGDRGYDGGRINSSRESKGEAEETELSTTPGAITLETLFRTASLQQGQKPHALQRSTSVSSGTAAKSGEFKMEVEQKHKSMAADELPPLLRHIMSSGSMVEDIERQHIQRGDDKTPGATTGIPDVSQPPPNHPAYRGPSPQTRQSRKSPRQQQVQMESVGMGAMRHTESEPSLERASSGSGIAPMTSPQILASNLLPQFPTGSSSQLYVGSGSQSSGDIQRLSPEVSKSQTSPRGTDRSEGVTVPKPSEPLLTPADLLASSFSSSTSVSSTQPTVTTKAPDKVVNPSLATAAASLITSTELLSPFAFLTSSSSSSSATASRKTPPAISTESVPEERSVEGKRDDSVRVAALTKEQLQQALLYLVKNDSNFITTIHEAYLKSLHELSGSKS